MELALTMPFICTLLMGVVQVAVVARDRLTVQIAAREGARAAAVSARRDAAVTAAEAAVTLRPLRVRVTDDGRAVRVTVAYTDHTDVPLIGVLLPDVEVEATVAMAVEPP